MSKVILVCDDSRISRMMIKAIIADRKPDWTIIEAENGDDALAKVAETPFDVATLDLNMPGMDGLELAEKLQEIYPDATYSLLTANIQDTIKERAKKLNLTFIGKPITEDKIGNYLDSLSE